ncbi:MAG: HDOD domain-containing protein [Pseudomonadota bacterium]
MSFFLQRLLQAILGRRPHRTKTARATETSAGPHPAAATLGSAPAPVSLPEPPKVAAAVSALMAVGARRPLIATDGAIAGFEFRIDHEMQKRLQQDDDHQVQAAYVLALLTSAHLMVKTGRIGFARVPAEWLVHVAQLADVEGAWVGIEQSAGMNLTLAQWQTLRETVQALRAAGAKVGWDEAAVFGVPPDFLLLHQGPALMDVVLGSMRTWPPELKKLPVFVTDIACVEDLEQALYSGISYACGALAPPEPATEPLELLRAPPEFYRVGQLLNELASGADTSVIVSDIKRDIGLSYRLLCRINSASFAQLNAQASIDQAVLLLGHNELYRWLSLLLIQFSGRRKVTSALQEITLWRARLFELLAIETHETSPGQLFTLGLASMLGPLLKMSLVEVVSTLNLPTPARQALLEQTGPWSVYLQLALQVETKSLDGNSALVGQFGGAERVAALADEAWAWAWAAEHANREGVILE